MPKPSHAKPPYHVPSMDEIAAIPPNGYSVVSTFSGGGGSSLGYKLAGFRVLWANEFIPAAQETYRANFPATLLDGRDIRKIHPSEILEAVGLEQGELDVLDASPPCASFSTAGKREKGWGKVKAYSETEQRVDDLFFEFARILRGLQPKVFVAENVSGLVKGTAKGYFKMILKELRACGYTVESRLLDAQWLGVPQMRQRVIFVGVRNDLVETYGVRPAFPAPLPYRYSVREAVPWIVAVRIGGQRRENWQPAAVRPAGTVVQSDGRRSNTTAYMSSYLVEAETDISRYAIGDEWDKLEPGQRSEKYQQLKKPALDEPSPTITAPPNGSFSPTAPAGSASVVHPTEKRKFSIAELKRICSFPDDFVLTGSYAQQWERMGRAVPPLMMQRIAQTIQTEILDRCRST